MLCDVCDRANGWGKVNSIECDKCSQDEWVFNLVALLLLVVVTVIVLVLFKLQYNSDDSTLSAYSRIFFDYLQILSITSLYLTNLDFLS